LQLHAVADVAGRLHLHLCSGSLCDNLLWNVRLVASPAVWMQSLLKLWMKPMVLFCSCELFVVHICCEWSDSTAFHRQLSQILWCSLQNSAVCKKLRSMLITGHLPNCRYHCIHSPVSLVPSGEQIWEVLDLHKIKWACLSENNSKLRLPFQNNRLPKASEISLFYILVVYGLTSSIFNSSVIILAHISIIFCIILWNFGNSAAKWILISWTWNCTTLGKLWFLMMVPSLLKVQYRLTQWAFIESYFICY